MPAERDQVKRQDGVDLTSIFTPSCWTGCSPKRPGARWRFTRRRARATPRSRRRWPGSATECSGCWWIVGASVQRRVALGTRAGARVRRLGDAPAVTSRGPRQAHLDGFDLHANVWVSANDRAGLERLARYVLRPPFAQERLRLRSDGRIALELKQAWHDGTRELVFEPLEFLERLAAMTPRPETNLLICHGVLAPRARGRERVVAYGWVVPGPTSSAAPLAAGPDGTGVTPTPRAWTWAALMHRAFAIDILACVHCGGRLRLIATLHDPAVIRKILAHLDLAHSGQSPGPAPPEFSAAAP